MSDLATKATLETGDHADAVRAPQDVLDHLLRPEVQESLTMLIENLPKLTEMLTVMTQAYDFAQQIATDRVLVDDLTGGLRDFVKPVAEKAKQWAAISMEAGERARAEQTPINVFGLLRMVKDPQVQSVLRYAQALLSVTAERQAGGAV